MKKLLFLTIITFSILIFAEQKRIYQYGHFENNSKTYLFGDNVRIRKEPLIKNNIVDTLPIGTQVTVLEKDKAQKIGSINQNWYRINYKIKGKSKSGYVWGALLALTYTENSGYLYLFGLKEYRKNSLYGECRLVKNKKLISKIEISPHATAFEDNIVYGYSVSSLNYTDKKLNGVDRIIKLSFIYEACGYTYGDIYLGQLKNKMFLIIKTDSVSEAGLFAYTESVIFPSDKGGIKNMIQKKILGEEYNEEINDYEIKTDKIEKYRIVGTKVQKLK